VQKARTVRLTAGLAKVGFFFFHGFFISKSILAQRGAPMTRPPSLFGRSVSMGLVGTSQCLEIAYIYVVTLLVDAQ
jgi:hypothetical protein